MKRSTNLESLSGTRPDVRPDYERRIQNLVAGSLEKKSRDGIARRMTEILRREITCSMLDNFSAGNKVTARFPASFVSAFCDACGDDRLRLEVMGVRLRRLVEFAEKILAAARSRRQTRELIDFMRDSLSAGDDRKELQRILGELLKEEGRRNG